MSASSQLANSGCSHTVQRLNSWAQQQAPRQQQRKYGLNTTLVAAAGPFHSAIVDFLQQQYRQEGLQPDASCVSIAGMMAARLSPASWQPYSSVFGMFVRFCILRDLQFLPAAPLTGVMWAEFLASKGTVKAASAQPYFSAVNTVHTLLGFDRPCADNAMLVSFRRGWERQQVTLQPPPAVAGLALPPESAYAFYTGLPRARAPAVLRSLLFSLLCYVLVLRPASLLSVAWVRVHDGMLQYKPLHWKGKRLQPADAPVLQFPVRGLPFLSDAVSRLLAVHNMPGGVWRFRGEPVPATPAAEGWFAAACQFAGFDLSLGRYTLYSTRRGGASAAAAVGVPLHKLEVLGGWQQGSSALRQHYIDHGVHACAHARFFFAALAGAAVSPASLFNR